MALHGPATDAARRLRELTRGAGVDIEPAIARFEARLAAIEQM